METGCLIHKLFRCSHGPVSRTSIPVIILISSCLNLLRKRCHNSLRVTCRYGIRRSSRKSDKTRNIADLFFYKLSNLVKILKICINRCIHLCVIMRICMHSDRMSLIISLFDHIFIFRHGSCNKKRCFRIVFIQNVQRRLRILRRSVIQRQIDNFFIRLFCCTHFSSWLNCKFTSVICLIFLALIFFIGCISFILIDRKFFCSCFFL